MSDNRRSWTLLGTGGPCDETAHVQEFPNPFGQPFELMGISCSMGLEMDRQADLGANVFRVRRNREEVVVGVDWITFFRRDAYANPAGQADMMNRVQWVRGSGWTIDPDDVIRVEWFATRVGVWGANGVPVQYGIDMIAEGRVL